MGSSGAVAAGGGGGVPAWTAFTPAITTNGGTDPSYGTGATREGRYVQAGKLVIVRAEIAFGTGGGFAVGNGVYGIVLPVAPLHSTREGLIGTCQYYLGSGTAAQAWVLLNAAVSNAAIHKYDDAVTLSQASGWNVAGGGNLRFNLAYEAA